MQTHKTLARVSSILLLAAIAVAGVVVLKPNRIAASNQRSDQPSPAYRSVTQYATPVEPISEDLAAVVRRSQSASNPPPARIPNHHLEEMEAPTGSRAAEPAERRPVSPTGEAGPALMPVGPSFTLTLPTPAADLQFDTNAYSNLNRPDSAIAAGPSDLVTAVNFAFQVQDLKGGNQMSIGFNAFFPNDPTQSIGDPRLSYDQSSGRFIMSCLGFDYPKQKGPTDTGDSWCDLAVSATGDPRGRWHKYSFHVLRNKTEQMDFDSLGYDGQAIYITGRTRDFAKGTSVSGNRLLIINKARALAGAPLQPHFVDDLKLPGSSALAEILKPVEPCERVTQNSPAYFLCTMGTNAIALYTLTDPFGTRAFKSVRIPIPTWVSPNPAPQPGGPPTLIQAAGFPLHKTMIRDGVIWSCQSISDLPVLKRRAGIAVYKVDPVRGELLESHWIFDPALSFYLPAIVPDSSGNVVAGFAGSDAKQYPSIYHARYVASQRKFEKPVLTAAGTISFNTKAPAPESQDTWGDYIDAAPDVASGGRKVWIHAELPVTATTWKMHAARIPSAQ